MSTSLSLSFCVVNVLILTNFRNILNGRKTPILVYTSILCRKVGFSTSRSFGLIWPHIIHKLHSILCRTRHLDWIKDKTAICIPNAQQHKTQKTGIFISTRNEEKNSLYNYHIYRRFENGISYFIIKSLSTSLYLTFKNAGEKRGMSTFVARLISCFPTFPRIFLSSEAAGFF